MKRLAVFRSARWCTLNVTSRLCRRAVSGITVITAAGPMERAWAGLPPASDSRCSATKYFLYDVTELNLSFSFRLWFLSHCFCWFVFYSKNYVRNARNYLCRNDNVSVILRSLFILDFIRWLKLSILCSCATCIWREWCGEKTNVVRISRQLSAMQIMIAQNNWTMYNISKILVAW